MTTTAEIFTAIASGLALVSVGAVLKVVSRFLRHVEDKDKQFTTFLSNHLHKHTEALLNVAHELQALRHEVQKRA